MNNILQWNIRGLQANREELNILLSNFNPILVSLQETFLKPNKITTFKNYSLYNLPSEESNGTIHGGIAILSMYVPSIYLHHPNLTAVIWIILLANYLPPFYCWETSMPTVPYGAALKPITEERLLKISC